MRTKKKILVTGAAGSVGLEVIRQLSGMTDRYDIIAIDQNKASIRKKLRPWKSSIKIVLGDLGRPEISEQVSSDVDFTIHLAAVIPPLADQQPELAERVNVRLTEMLLQNLEIQSPNSFFLYASSVSVYGDRVLSPWLSVKDQLNPSPGDEYAITKIRAEERVQASKLKHSIFRLTAVMGSQTRMDPLMFHMPLDTRLEIITASDAATAFINAIENTSCIDNQIFNLAGGPGCRVVYRNFINEVFKIMGLKELDFPHHAFAQRNFHCGWYLDSDILEDILHFQHDTIYDYYEILKRSRSGIVVWLTSVLRSSIKRKMLLKSHPYQAIKKKYNIMQLRFFGKVIETGL